MGVFLNPGYANFEAYKKAEIFVDKSELLRFTNNILESKDAYICVSRPRRFGKTLAASMLTAYYDKTRDSHNLFNDLLISKNSSYEEFINKYNVISINLATMLSFTEKPSNLIANLCNSIIKELKEVFPDCIKPDYNLVEALNSIYLDRGEKFVFVIDEWDCLFRELPSNVELQKKYLNFLKGLLKDQAYVALAYMTGILPIKKYGTHSALNIFTEHSMIDMLDLAEFTGFTEDEVQKLCLKYDIDFDEMNKWYDGYTLNNFHIYNPHSIVMALKFKKFKSYWTQTETYESLKYYINLNFDGLKDIIIRLITGDKYHLDTTSFTNDMITFEFRDDILTLLIHLGYLSYNGKEVFIPNNEIRKEFLISVRTSKWKGMRELIENSEHLLNATLNGDENTVAAIIEEAHSKYTSIIKYNDENSLSCVVAMSYFYAMSDYTMLREMPTGKGFVDFIFIPKRESNKTPIIFELKFGKTADEAIKQIKERCYTDTLKAQDYKDVILVGINYDKNTKKHECKIERIVFKNQSKNHTNQLIQLAKY